MLAPLLSKDSDEEYKTSRHDYIIWYNAPPIFNFMSALNNLHKICFKELIILSNRKFLQKWDKFQNSTSRSVFWAKPFESFYLEHNIIDKYSRPNAGCK